MLLAVILGLIIVSFGFWGVNDFLGGASSNDLASVGTAHVSVEAFRNAYQTELSSLQQQAKRVVTSEEARQIGLDRQVLARLLSDSVMDEQAKKLDLVVGNPAIAAAIMNDPSFQDRFGRFDRAQYDRLVPSYREAAYVSELRTGALRQKLTDAITADIAVPRALAETIHRYQMETRAIDFIDLPAAVAGEIPKPTDAEVSKYYEDRKSLYVAPEMRKLVTLAVVPADLVKPDAISDADVQKRYDETKAIRFVSPERRTVQQIVFPDEAEARAAKAKLDGGESFEALATERKLTPKEIDLGSVLKSALTEPAVAEAAFALPEGSVSEPIKTRSGAALLRVTKIIPMTQQPLIEVSAQLKDELAIIRAKADALKDRDAIEDQRKAGKSLSEVAASVGLKVKTIDAVDAQGFDPTHKPVEGIVDGPAMLKAAFASQPNSDTDMITTGADGYVWYEVVSVENERQLPLADVRAKVEAGWRSAETAKRLAAKAEEIVKSLDGGEPLTAIAKRLGNLKIMHDGDIKRGGAPSLPQNVGVAVFSVPVHKAGSTAMPDGGRVVFQVLDAVEPPMDAAQPDFKALIEKVKGSYIDDTLGQYLAGLELTFGIKVNKKALDAAVGDPNVDPSGS